MNLKGIPTRFLTNGFRRTFVVLAAGVAVLAMLGSDPSAKTDYAAHIFGLIAGVLIGLIAGSLRRYLTRIPPLGEKLLAVGIVGLLVIAWEWAILHALSQP